MKGYLIAIDNELQENFTKFISNIKNTDSLQFETITREFCDNIIAVLDYYVAPIFNNGKMVTDKKLGIPFKKDDFNDEEVEFIKNYKLNELTQFGRMLKTAIINCYEYRDSDKSLYEQISEVIIDKYIKLFKHAQLIEYKNQNITKVNLISDDKVSCAICQTMSKFTYDIDKLINLIDESHSFCKLTFEPINSNNFIDFTIDKTNITFLNLPNSLKENVKSIITTLKIYCPEKMLDKNFIVVDNINNESDFIGLLQNKYDSSKIEELQQQIKNTLGLFEIGDKIFIGKDHLNKIDYFIVKYLLQDNLLKNDLTWWETEYNNNKQKTKYVGDGVSIYASPFINYIAEQNHESYFLESAIYYILSPQLLKDIDLNNYNELKQKVFNNIEFIRS